MSSLAPPSVAGHRLLRLLGAGGFAEVWEAMPAGLPGGLEADVARALVALKISLASGAEVDERFAREAEALHRVGPPHVPALRGTGVLADRRRYISMERLTGTTLSSLLEAMAGPPRWSDLQGLFDAILASVAAVHRAGLVHRDLKPENLFLSGSPPAATLIDFGLARAFEAPPAAEPVSVGEQPALQARALTPSEARAGTPEYMAPEQIRGGLSIDTRTDVYSLGVILYELLTLRLPFAGDRAEVEQGHLNLKPPRPSLWADLPPALEAVVLRCLAKEPEQRPGGILALRDALRGALADSGGAVRPAPPHSPAPPAGGPTKRDPATARARAGLLFCRMDPGKVVQVREALEASGGQLAHVAGELVVGAFTARSGEHPVRRALAAARGLDSRQLCGRILIDLQPVVAVERSAGSPRLVSPLFARASHYPGAGDPAGVLLTAAAADALAGDVIAEPLAGRSDRFALRRELATASDMTLLQRPIGRLLGRAATMEALIAGARAAVAGHTPAIVTLTGEQGLGKSHVAAALAEELLAQLPDAELLTLRCGEPIAGDTEGLLVELLRHALGIGDAGAEDGRRLVEARLGADLAAEVHSAVALVLGWVGPDDPGVARLRASPGVLRAAASRALGEGLRRRAHARPLCLIVDDAHWADPTSLDGLEYATADDARVALWVAVFVRPGFERARPAWGTRAPYHRIERLAPLDRDSAVQLCRLSLAPAEHVPQSAIERLVERSQGNPLLLLDLVGGLRSQGLIQTRPGGGATLVTELLDQMPDMPVVEWIAAREIESLSPGLASYARLAASLGSDFTAEEFEGIASELDRSGAYGSLRIDAGVGIRQLCEAGLLVRHRDDRYGFRNSLSRDVLAAWLPEPAQRLIHCAALAYYRRAIAMDAARRLPRLALHAAAAGERAEAVQVYLELAEAARGRHAYLEAELLFSRALDHLDPEDERRLPAVRGRGIMRYRTGRYDDSLADLRLARDLAGARRDRQLEADILLDAAMALDWLEEWRESREATRRAQELIEPADPPLLRARLLQALGRSATRFNQDLDSIRHYEEAIRVAEPLGDEAYEVRVVSLLLLGYALPFVGRPDDAEACLERALAQCQSRGDELHLGAVYNNRSCLWIARNDQRRALDDMDRARAYARRLGISNLERMVELNLGIYLYWLGELDAAEPHVRRLIELDHRRMRSGMRPDGQVLLARLLLVRGDLDGCRRELAEVMRHQDEASRQDAGEVLLMPNDQVLFDAATLAVTGGSAAEWDTVCARAREVSQGQELIEVMELRGLAAARAGQIEAARAAWRRALEAGERIPNVFDQRLRRRLAELSAREH